MDKLDNLNREVGEIHQKVTHILENQEKMITFTKENRTRIESLETSRKVAVTIMSVLGSAVTFLIGWMK